MKISRIEGPNMRAAMNTLRQSYGADAVILETTDTPDGVEIVVARDYDPQATESPRTESGHGLFGETGSHGAGSESEDLEALRAATRDQHHDDQPHRDAACGLRAAAHE